MYLVPCNIRNLLSLDDCMIVVATLPNQSIFQIAFWQLRIRMRCNHS